LQYGDLTACAGDWEADMMELPNILVAESMHQTQSGIDLAGEIKVSVIIPAFNASKTILRAIDSVRDQHIKSLEIIVIDDGSVDGTPEVVLQNIHADENIKLVKMQQNSGVSAARNAGINRASGKFLAFLDADDIWLSGKIQKQINVMELDPAITLVSCNSRLVSEEGIQLKVGHINRPPAEGINAWKTLLIYNFLPTPTILTYRSLVKEIGGFDESLAIAEDLDLWIKLAVRGKVAIVNEVLTHYYDSAGSLMKRYSGETKSILVPMLNKHIAAHRNRLTNLEHREILGRQAFNVGCDLFFSGAYLRSITPFFKASIKGTRPIKSLIYIPRAIFMDLVSRIFKENISRK
jgi:glycosyltransferase involved in cell wall biosynthesis